MIEISVTYVDGGRDTFSATRWHKKDDYLWISRGNGGLVLVSLLSTRCVRIQERKKKPYTDRVWPTVACDSTTLDPEMYIWF